MIAKLQHNQSSLNDVFFIESFFKILYDLVMYTSTYIQYIRMYNHGLLEVHGIIKSLV